MIRSASRLTCTEEQKKKILMLSSLLVFESSRWSQMVAKLVLNQWWYWLSQSNSTTCAAGKIRIPYHLNHSQAYTLVTTMPLEIIPRPRQMANESCCKLSADCPKKDEARGSIRKFLINLNRGYRLDKRQYGWLCKVETDNVKKASNIFRLSASQAKSHDNHRHSINTFKFMASWGWLSGIDALP